MKRRTAGNPRNIYPENWRSGRAVFPHERIYRDTILEHLPQDALDRIHAAAREYLARPKPPKDDPAAWAERLRDLGGLEDPAEAISIVGRATADHALTLARWGYEEVGDLRGAIRLYEMVRSESPDDVEARLGLVRCGAFWSEPRLRDDPKARLSVLDGLPDDPRVLFLRAEALLGIERTEEARPLLEAAASGRGSGTVDALHALWQLTR